MIITRKRLSELLKQREEETWKAMRAMEAEERAEKLRCRTSDVEHRIETLEGRVDAFEIALEHFAKNCGNQREKEKNESYNY